MGLMSDLFKRGYSFDGASGLKTGANLEDLVTRAVLTSGSQIADQVFITDAASASITDDAGAAIRQLTIKDASITAAKMATGNLWGAKQTIVTGDIVVAGFTPPASWENMLDGNSATLTDEFSFTGSANYAYVDLGSVKEGWIRAIGDVKGSDTNGSGFNIFASYTTATAFTLNGTSFNNVTTGYLTYGQMFTFVGRYVGIRFSCSETPANTGYSKMRRFDVYVVS